MTERQERLILPDWKAYADRHNMTWSKKAFSWDSGAILGNGFLGAMVYSAEDKTKRNTLRFVMGRTDVEAVTPGREDVYTRVPIGEMDLELKGWIFDGTTMELHLYEAELQADLVTTAGKAGVRTLIHSLEPVLMVEAHPAEGEHVSFRWCGYPDVPVITKNEDGINYNQYIPEIALAPLQEGDVFFQIQRYTAPGQEPGAASGEDGCVIAWCSQDLGDGGVRFYLSIEKGCDPEAMRKAGDHVRKAAACPVEDFVESHRNWWKEYYEKSFVSFTDTRLEGFYLIQMYKLAAAARGDSPIMDNQGPWMAATPWPRAWFNMNVQMAYSPVYTSNHLEIGESLCNQLDAHVDSLIANVAPEFRHDSAGLGRSAGTNLRSDVEDEVGNLTWVLHNYWRQYRYSMDDDRLRDHLYPLLKRSVQYYIHLLNEGEDGKLHLPEMISPEYGSFRHQTVEDSTYDLSLLRWGCETLLKICDRLEIVDEAAETWRMVLDRLVDYHQDETGLMIGKDVPLEFGHRHFSHLLPVFPLHLIHGDTEEERALVHKCLRHWFHKEGDLRGFTFDGAASLAATIGAGDEALAYVQAVLHQFKPNTMYKEAGPVIESPLAAAEAINDMLLQSWGEEIRIFPAVPSQWPDVTFHDLRAEGGFLVSAVRRGGKTQWVRVRSLAGEPCRIRTDLGREAGGQEMKDGPSVSAVCGVLSTGEACAVTVEANGDLCLDLQKGQEAYLYAGEKPEFVIEAVKPKKHLMNYFGESKPWRLYGIPFED